MTAAGFQDRAIPADLLLRVVDLFRRLGWHTTDQDDDEASVFTRFCTMLASLKEDERQLILTITEDFLRCPFGKYKQYLRRALAQLPPDVLDQTNTILLVPLIAPGDIGKVKSAHAAMYVCRNHLASIYTQRGTRILALDKPSLLDEEHRDRIGAVVLLVDDFVGSGETAQKAMDDFDRNRRVESDTAFILTLVALESGVQMVRAAGWAIAAGDVRRRGISDSTRLRDVEEAKRVMQRIERRLRVPPEYKHGFRRTEALVSMERCPNNTFPLYWTTREIEGSAWPAPFPR